MPLVAAFHGSFFAPFMLYKYPPAVSQAIIGEHTPTSYTSLLETDVNRKFVKAFRAKYNETPEDTETGPYQAIQVLLAALEATGGDTNPKKLRVVK